MVRRYDIIGRRVRSARNPIVARTAPAVERLVGKEYVNCMSSCVKSQRDCHTDARNAYQAATKECVDNRKECISTCKKPVFVTEEE